MTGQRSAVVAAIRLPGALESIRRAHVAHARVGVPAHVTLLFPFVPPALIDEATANRAGAAIARTAAFDVEFVEVATWEPGPTSPEGVVWLPPMPARPFIAMTEALVAAFPACRPYEGIHDEVIPHLTLANEAVDNDALGAAIGVHLPFSRRLTEALLLVEGRGGRWRRARRFPLRPARPEPR